MKISLFSIIHRWLVSSVKNFTRFDTIFSFYFWRSYCLDISSWNLFKSHSRCGVLTSSGLKVYWLPALVGDANLSLYICVAASFYFIFICRPHLSENNKPAESYLITAFIASSSFSSCYWLWWELSFVSSISISLLSLRGLDYSLLHAGSWLLSK